QSLPAETPAVVLPLVSEQPATADRPNSRGLRIVDISPPNARPGARVAQSSAPSLFGDENDSLFAPPPPKDTGNAAEEPSSTDAEKPKKEDDSPPDLSVLGRNPLFSPDPCYDHVVADPQAELAVYEGKYCFPTQRPWV